MTVGSWKAANFIIPDYAGGDDLFDFRGDDGTTGGDGAATMPPSLYSYGLQDLFGRLEDLLSHSAPPEVLQAIHNALQNVIEQLPHIDLPNLPDLSYVWHEGGAALPGGEYAGVAGHGVEGAPSNPVASSVVASQPPPSFYGSGSGVSGPDQSDTGHYAQSNLAGVTSHGADSAPSNPVASNEVASQPPPTGFYGSGSAPDLSGGGPNIPYLSHDWW